MYQTLTYDEIKIGLYLIIAIIMLGFAGYYIYKSFFCGYKFIIKLENPDYILIVTSRTSKYPFCHQDKVSLFGELIYKESYITYKYNASYLFDSRWDEAKTREQLSLVVERAVKYVKANARFDHNM